MAGFEPRMGAGFFSKMIGDEMIFLNAKCEWLLFVVEAMRGFCV
jgi:hypothetical protein